MDSTIPFKSLRTEIGFSLAHSIREVICSTYRNYLIIPVSKESPPHFKTARPPADKTNFKSVAAWLLAITALVLALTGAYFLGASNATVTEVEILIPTPAPAVVQITGEVRSPGVYELNRDDRVLAAIEAAGGMTEYADIEKLNLAATIKDGSLINVPSLRPTPSTSLNLTQSQPDSGATDGGGASEIAPVSNPLPNPFNQPIDINSATVDELQSLPGIGETRANQIIALRTVVGRFSTLEQLLDIHGIGEKTLEAIRPLVVVE